MTGIDQAHFRQVLGHYPTGVCIVTAIDATGAPLALVVGSFTSASLDPPQVGFLVTRTSSTWAALRTVGSFCINVLANDQEALSRQLAKPGPARFDNVAFGTSALGMPLVENAIVHIECSLRSTAEAGDHWFVLADVLSLGVAREGSPLLFHRGRYASLQQRHASA